MAKRRSRQTGVSVVVERAPGGGNGWSIQAASQRIFTFCQRTGAVAIADKYMEEIGIGVDERTRVTDVLGRELARRLRAEVVAVMEWQHGV